MDTAKKGGEITLVPKSSLGLEKAIKSKLKFVPKPLPKPITGKLV